MTPSDTLRNPTIRTLRQFAAAWLVFLLVTGAHQYFAKHRPALGATLAVLALAAGLPGCFKPALVRWLFLSMVALTRPLGWLVSQLMLLLIFYLVLTPLALLLRCRGRDALARKPAPERASYWTPVPARDIQSYFRQH